jgi:hypothetical protein
MRSELNLWSFFYVCGILLSVSAFTFVKEGPFMLAIWGRVISGMLGVFLLTICMMMSGCVEKSERDLPVSASVTNTVSISEEERVLLQPNFAGVNLEADLQGYYEKWKNGNHYDASGVRRSKPGYVQRLKFKEEVSLPWENEGSAYGAIVVMIPNGTADELPGEYCVSTSEAMGYGLIIAALMDDRVLFDDLLRVVLYYRHKDSQHLMSWAVPAEKGADWFESDIFENLSDAAKREWRETGVRYEPLYEENTEVFESTLVGEANSLENLGGSASDGDLDIAYALYLAHRQWGDEGYLRLARLRFEAFFDKIVDPFGQLGEAGASIYYLPAGDYRSFYAHEGKFYTHAITRSSDWMAAQIRHYYEDSKDERAIALVEGIYSKVTLLSNPQTGLVSDFAMWVFNNDAEVESTVGTEEGRWELIPAGSSVSNEWLADAFYMNASRYPFRLAMDYYLYGESRGLEASQKILEFFIEKHGFNSASDFSRYPSAAHDLDGRVRVEAQWHNPVLGAALYSVAAISGDEKYQGFVNNGWRELTKFDSRYYDWSQNGLGYEANHSGYFSDTWRLMSMLLISGKW